MMWEYIPGRQCLCSCLLILCLLLIVPLSTTILPDNSKERSLNTEAWLLSLHEYELVLPQRLDPHGNTYPQHRHYLHKRSIEPSNGRTQWDNTYHSETNSSNGDTLSNNTAASWWSSSSGNETLHEDSTLRYSIGAFGETLLLEVSLNAEITAPLVLFEEEYGGGAGEANARLLSPEDYNAHCLYHGRIRRDGIIIQDSDVVLSLCHNMMGSIRWKDHHYLIEPLPNATSSPSSQSVHVIYKPHPHTLKHCASMDANYKHERWKDPSVPEDTPSNSSTRHRRSAPTDGDGGGRRKKRSILSSYQRNVEVMVVADKKMADFHGSDLHDYLFVIMSIVASIYRHPSIGNSINIVIVRIHVLKDERAGPTISANAASTLTSFCRYQRKINNPDDTSPQHHDTAVLVTRHGLCRAQNECDTLGLAELGTMCDINRSCSIAKDNGLSTAFTIAHELGHVFNLMHDDDDECLEHFPQQTKEVFKVMAPTLDHSVDVYSWSLCSKKTMTQFLDDGYGDCLLDEPADNSFENKMARLTDIRPGEIYDVNQQCEQAFGKGYRICPFLAKCERLFCQNSAINNAQCITQHMRWGEGTRCNSNDPNMWCQAGQCVPEHHPKEVDGGWSSWSNFGHCSRTCGGGVKKSMRYCTNPEPKNGGEYCLGKRVRYKSCNTVECLDGSEDFREEQCAAMNGRHFNMNGIPMDVQWAAKYDGVKERDRCKLFCKVVNSNSHSVVSFFPPTQKVTDGTKCGPDTSDICVAGHCQQAGCDNHLGSRMKRDKCGVCGGDNTSCRFVQQSYNEVRYGYHGNFTIPAGALNIDIRQRSYTATSADDTYLALKVPGTDTWILNGIVEQRGQDGKIARHKMVTPFRKTVNVNGTAIEYSGSNNVEERINITQAIREPLQLLVLSVGELYPPGVRWNYLISKPGQGFAWSNKGPWTRCTHICQGERSRQLVCVSIDDGRRVSNQRCESDPAISKPPEISRQCNTHCTVSWEVENGECSAACGIGIMLNKVKCHKNILRSQRSKQVDDGHCTAAARGAQPRPPDRQPCRGQCLHTHWEYDLWSKCSSSCGGGVQYRTAHCLDSHGNKVDVKQCSAAHKYVVQRCNEETCPAWHASDWTGCSVSCGSGWRLRQVSCKRDGVSVSKTLCPPDEEPDTQIPCHNPACPVWHVGHWGQCSVSCGEGLKRRAVKCRLDSGIILKNEECDHATQPRFQTTCFLMTCVHSTTPTVAPTSTSTEVAVTRAMEVAKRMETVEEHGGRHTEWRTGSWTQCSATCGSGQHHRYVSCRDMSGAIADDNECSHTSRPAEREACILKACGMWRTGEWTQCSVSCNSGVETRQVACTVPGVAESVEDSQYCDASIRPPSEQACNVQPCPVTQQPTQPHHPTYPTQPEQSEAANTANWRFGGWSSCSSTCEGGWQRRAVVCHDENGPSDACDRSQKPPHITACNSGPCPQWNYGGWGQCSVTCGNGGSRQRVIRCQLPSGDILPDTSCDLLQRPRHEEMCNFKSCPGESANDVTQHDNNKEHNNDHNNNQHNDRLSIFKQHYPYWYKGQWSECSIDCSKNKKRSQRVRLVECRNGTDAIEQSLCAPQRKPRSRRRCARHGRNKCPHWSTSKWSQCSTSCGVGIRKREVRCIEGRRRKQNGADVNDERCEGDVRPRDTEFCELRECQKYQWRTGQWGECSAHCGNGRKVRSVECMDTEHDHPVNASLCDDQQRPKRKRRCAKTTCPYMWVEGDWSECSSSCGGGVQYRDVTCRALSREGWILEEHGEHKCPSNDRPVNTKLCNRGDCNALYHWVQSTWGECSRSCGLGRAKRQVQCMSITGEQHDGSNCVARYKPPTTKSCYLMPCYATSCSELQRGVGGSGKVRTDGEYNLLIPHSTQPQYTVSNAVPDDTGPSTPQLLKVYCANMKRRRPIEYLTLPSGENENFARVDKLRLEDPSTCPTKNGSVCSGCLDTPYPHAGFTAFHRVRLNITQFTITVDDFKFSRTGRDGKRVSYASAGDCYSSKYCPQGEFKLNLRGTVLRLSESVQWFSKGHRTSQRILMDKSRQVVDGKCGGHCGHCSPNKLQLELLPPPSH